MVRSQAEMYGVISLENIHYYFMFKGCFTKSQSWVSQIHLNKHKTWIWKWQYLVLHIALIIQHCLTRKKSRKLARYKTNSPLVNEVLNYMYHYRWTFNFRTIRFSQKTINELTTWHFQRLTKKWMNSFWDEKISLYNEKTDHANISIVLK